MGMNESREFLFPENPQHLDGDHKVIIKLLRGSEGPTKIYLLNNNFTFSKSIVLTL